MSDEQQSTNRGRKWSFYAIAVLFAAACAAALYVVSAPSIEQLKAEGDKIIAELERYRTERKVYPASAEAAGVVLPKTRYGYWTYSVSDDRTSFELSVGDYQGFDPFTLFWSTESGEWHLDR